MLTEDYINDLLCSVISEYGRANGKLTQKLVYKVTSKLSTQSVKAVFDGITYFQALKAINKVGNIVMQNDESQECTAVVFSGGLNMNPAFIALKSEGDKTYIAAFAKEGIIKQHTAQKAINSIFNSINKNT